MDEKKSDLLGYTRTLYDRQSNKASKAGMTYWAILAGVIYTGWHFLKTVAEVPASSYSNTGFYLAFSQTHLAILSISLLIRKGAPSRDKKKLDYRVWRDDEGFLEVSVFSLAFLLPLFFTTMKARSEDSERLLFIGQMDINFWLIVFLLFCVSAFGVSRYIAFSKNRLPPVTDLTTGTSKFNSISYLIINLILLEVFLGNALNVVALVYGSSQSSLVQTAALDLSLIISGLFMLFLQGQGKEYLNGLARLERDIVIHDISEREIIERLQDDHLGRYVGDWLEQLIRGLREKGEVLSKESERVDELIAEVDAIDVAYSKERSGRIREYLHGLDEKSSSYEDTAQPLLAWLKEASRQFSLHRDSFMLSVVESSVEEIEASSKEVHERTLRATKRIKEWQKGHSSRP